LEVLGAILPRGLHVGLVRIKCRRHAVYGHILTFSTFYSFMFCPLRGVIDTRGEDLRNNSPLAEVDCAGQGMARLSKCTIRMSGFALSNVNSTAASASPAQWQTVLSKRLTARALPSGMASCTSCSGQQFSLWTRSERRVRARGLQEGSFVGV